MIEISTDKIALGAVATSVLALMVSIASARYSAIQAGVTRRKERSEVASQKPVVETKAEKRPLNPGWYEIDFTVRNRAGVPIICERLQARKPANAKLLLLNNPQQGWIEEALGQMSIRLS